jgi:hypothetical protein
MLHAAAPGARTNASWESGSITVRFEVRAFDPAVILFAVRSCDH